jgi:hypothetical protein
MHTGDANDGRFTVNSILHRTTAFSAAGLVVAGGALVGAVTDAQAAPEARTGPVAVVQPEPPGEGKRVLDHHYQPQPNSYYCAPAATRIALTTQGKVLSQQEVAKKLQTTTAGTDSVEDTTRVLNELTGGGYETTEIDGATASPQEVDKLRRDVVEAIDGRRGVVANITGAAADTTGEKRAYVGGHYLSIVGYRDGGEFVRVADPYDPEAHYWMRDDDMADWIAERGYSS